MEVQILPIDLDSQPEAQFQESLSQRKSSKHQSSSSSNIGLAEEDLEVGELVLLVEDEEDEALLLLGSDDGTPI
ncbi:hypothetical protein E2C01_011295 [Portunus trituberculatus]|uniref:Uncharacterized protein n=1 Tax=Portunus trituberculatus TaxID=210409 RepID=A0A5B7DAP1_PORTR|nr:hypothetical protein [Portunus trituberculatus]